jgi:uncharacterized protein (DUF302 family)
MSDNFSFQVILDVPYEVALEKVTSALKKEGFGVLTEIDVKATLKNKLDVDFDKYSILGACNPPLAYKVLSSEPLVGLMLPCNVTVRDVEGKTEIAIINPNAMLSIDVLEGNQGIQEVADDAAQRLMKVAAALEE